MERIDSTENFIRLLSQYQNLVFSVCLKMTGDYFAAEDLTQDTFLAAYQHRKEFDGRAEKAWLCRIASNKSIDYLRSVGHRVEPVPEEELPEHGSTENEPLRQMLNKEVLQELKEACDRLKPPYQELAVRHFLEGKTTAEIAMTSGGNIHTVKTQLRRAREQLKKLLGKEWLE